MVIRLKFENVVKVFLRCGRFHSVLKMSKRRACVVARSVATAMRTAD